MVGDTYEYPEGQGEGIDLQMIFKCQEQIDLSGFVANDLSAFTALEWRAI